MVGNGLASVIFVSFRIICTLILPPDESKGKDDQNSFYGCLVFFSIGGIINLITIVCSFYIFKSSFAHFHLERANRKSLLQEFDEKDEVIENKAIANDSMAKRYLETYKAILSIDFNLVKI